VFSCREAEAQGRRVTGTGWQSVVASQVGSVVVNVKLPCAKRWYAAAMSSDS
jgi:hypothetical protein